MPETAIPQLADIRQVSDGWIKKYVLTYTLPDGSTYEYESASRKSIDAYCAELEGNARGERPVADAVCIVPQTADGKLLLIRPRLLLLDEPTKGLDVPARRAIARILRARRADGVTVVMATHDLDFVEQVADDVSMMFDGEVACTEPSEEFFRGNVYYRP